MLMHDQEEFELFLQSVETLEESNAWVEVPRHDEFVEVSKLTC